jgi:cellulose biosynthesis protein BcsQ
MGAPVGGRIAFFNSKGGVGKTTTVLHLGWMLASKGKRVVLVDCDPQCSLTGTVTGFVGATDFEELYRANKVSTLREGLAPVFESGIAPITPVDCLSVPGVPHLYLLPGHIGLAEVESTLGMAQELASHASSLRNIPGAISHLFDVTAEKYKADYVLLDMPPSMGSLNQNLLMSSDYFIIPMTPDALSAMAIDSMLRILPKWKSWSDKVQQSLFLQESVYPFPKKQPRLLGYVLQRYQIYAGRPSRTQEKQQQDIQEAITNRMAPVLQRLEMMLPEAKYQEAGAPLTAPLIQAPEFHSLLHASEMEHVPLFSLTDEQLAKSVGTGPYRAKIQAAMDAYSAGADKVVALTS